MPPFRGTENANKINEKPALKNNAPFRSCISKINDTFINNAKYLDIVVPMYNLLEYSDIILWYQEVYGIIINDDANVNNDTSNYRINKNKATSHQVNLSSNRQK